MEVELTASFDTQALIEELLRVHSPTVLVNMMLDVDHTLGAANQIRQAAIDYVDKHTSYPEEEEEEEKEEDSDAV